MFPISAFYHVGDLRAPPVENLAGNLKFVEICRTPRASDRMDDDSVMEKVKTMLRDHGETVCPQNGLEPACLANSVDIVKYLLDLEYKVSVRDDLSGMVDEDPRRRVEGSISLLRAVCNLGHADVAIALMEMGERPVQPDIECLALSCAFCAPESCDSGFNEDMQRCVLKMLSLGVSKISINDIRVVEMVFGTRCAPLIKRLLELCDSNVFKKYMQLHRGQYVQLHRDISSWAAYSDMSLLRLVGEKFGFSNGAELAEIASVTGNVEMFKLVCRHSNLTNMVTCILTVSEKGHLDLLKVMLEMIAAGKYRLQTGTLLHALYNAYGHLGIKELLMTHIKRMKYNVSRSITDVNVAMKIGEQSCMRGDAHLLEIIVSMDVGRYLDYNKFLCKACEYGCERIVRMLLESMDLHTKIDVNCSECLPIIMACQNGHVNLVRLLADVYSARVSRALLMYACKHGQLEVARLLIFRYGVDANASEGLALIEACTYGHAHVAMMLIEAGADPRSQDQLGLYTACSKGHIEIVKIFLGLEDISFSTAFKLACQNGHVRIMELLWNQRVNDCKSCCLQEIFMEMCANGAHVAVESFLTLVSDSCDMDYNGGLTRACRNGHLSIVELLIDQETAVNVNACKGLPLAKACKYGHIEIVKLLLANGAYIRRHDFVLDDIVDADIKELILKSNALRSPAKKQRVAIDTEMKMDMDTEMIPMIAV